MEAKHTPGPWEAVGNLVRSPMHQPEGLPTGVQVAECRDGYFLPHTEEAKANARLIAAAPELLEVAQEVLADDMLQYLPAEYVAKVRAAIAKATGEVQAPYTCRYCGRPSWLEPIDQAPPPDYCHDSDHGTGGAA